MPKAKPKPARRQSARDPNRKILGKENGIESRFVVWQWYWINGHLTTSDFKAKLLTALSRLRGHGDDSAVIILYSPAEVAPASLAAFAEAAGPQIHQMLRSDPRGSVEGEK